MDNKLDRKRALGRGLEQLFNTENMDLNSMEKQIYDTTPKEEIVELKLDELRVNPYQPRKKFDDDALNELALSIKEHGVFQPIIVKKSIKGYEIIAGERRCRASRIAGKETIPAIIRNFTDEQMMEIALLENLQRENLSAIEEAVAYKSMLEKLNLTQDELAKKVGKSRSHITNILGLLRLPNEVQQMVIRNEITMGHARAISKLDSQNEMINLANQIVNEKLPVREVEKISQNEEVHKRVEQKRKTESTNEYKYVEDMLRDKLDTKVKIKDNKIEICFNNVNDLNRILEILDVKE
ncbi:MAG: ParB/RepB/Spo0J family partition protein [Bacilli bacterium]|nr:ParB/RepB/Spo0J family partition protein [Bacilli bacterium]